MSSFFLAFRVGFTVGICTTVLASLWLTNQIIDDLKSEKKIEIIDTDYFIDDVELQ